MKVKVEVRLVYKNLHEASDAMKRAERKLADAQHEYVVAKAKYEQASQDWHKAFLDQPVS